MRKMDITNTASSSSSSPSPCSADEVAISPGDCVEGGVEEWLEDETLAGFRVWQLAGIVLSIILAIIVALCCCMRFRIPRTKQEIEADYVRKKITKNFRKELSKIGDTDMDEMDLRRALERVQADLDAENEELRKQRDNSIGEKSLDGLGARFHAMIHGIRTRFGKNTTASTNLGIPEPNDNEV